MSQFKVAARALIHLGSELITSDPIAIYELIKNSIDARSPDVKVHFHILFPHGLLNEVYDKWVNLKENCWQEEIEKDLEVLIEKKVWTDDLTYEQSYFIDSIRDARNPVEAAEMIQQLNYIEVVDTGSGMSAEELETVFLTIGTDSRLDKDDGVQPYLGNKGIGRISMMHLGKCATVISKCQSDPCHQIDFDWRQFSEPHKFLSDIAVNVQPGGELESNSGTKIKITHLTREWTQKSVKDLLVEKFLRRLRNPFEQKAYEFPIHIFFNGLTEKNRLPIPPLKPQLIKLAQRSLRLIFNPKHEVCLRLEITDGENKSQIQPFETSLVSLAHKFECTVSELEKIGCFQFSLKWFNRSKLREEIKHLGLSSNSTKLIDELNLWSGGIAIYRDGFRVGMSGSFEEKDFFQIDYKALRGSGFTLNRIQIIGALEISKKENMLLLDRSNREGLIENKQVELLSGIVVKIALPQLRDSINSDKANEKPMTLQKIIKEDIGSASGKLNSVKSSITSMQPHVSEEQRKVLEEIKNELHSVSNHVKHFETYSNQLQEQREDILELAGAGTLMHVVMHELARSTSQTRELMGTIAKSANPSVNKLLKKLEKEIKTINTRIRQFDPQSIAARFRPEKFDIVALIQTIISGYEAKAKRHDIQFKYTVNGQETTEKHYVQMVQGFISIALENLISNSAYWLCQNQTFSNYVYSDKKVISIELDTEAKTVSVWDSGLGIAPADKDRVFIPGFTTKKKSSDGKGFGLFIAREVTQFYEGSLYLDGTPDKDGRLRTFVLELPNKKD